MAGAGLFQVEVELEGVDEFLRGLEERGGDLSPIMAVIAEDLVSAVSDRYESEGDGEWPGHADSTIAKRRGGAAQSHKLLQDSGILAGSTEPNSGADFAEATTNVDYVRFHLDGGEEIPRRNPFELGDEVFEDAALAILDYVVEG